MWRACRTVDRSQSAAARVRCDDRRADGYLSIRSVSVAAGRRPHYRLCPTLPSMYEHEYEAMYQLENSYWWFVARRDLAVELLKNEINGQNSVRILDVGCGTGANATAFA